MIDLIGQFLGPLGTVVVIAAIVLVSGVKILREYERAVIFRLGRMVASRGPGITYVIPFVEKMLRVDLRTDRQIRRRAARRVRCIGRNDSHTDTEH